MKRMTSSFNNSILNYNKQDLENYYQEQLLLFHPFTISKESQLGKKNHGIMHISLVRVQ